MPLTTIIGSKVEELDSNIDVYLPDEGQKIKGSDTSVPGFTVPQMEESGEDTKLLSQGENDILDVLDGVIGSKSENIPPPNHPLLEDPRAHELPSKEDEEQFEKEEFPGLLPPPP